MSIIIICRNKIALSGISKPYFLYKFLYVLKCSQIFQIDCKQKLVEFLFVKNVLGYFQYYF
jgi:hypothetical protein